MIPIKLRIEKKIKLNNEIYVNGHTGHTAQCIKIEFYVARFIPIIFQ